MNIKKEDGTKQPDIDNYEAYKAFTTNPNVTTIFDVDAGRLYVD